MAWWQKKLLQYGLLRSGLFEDGALDLDDLNITWGRRSVVELKDVALNAKRIGKLARLPPSLRVEVARVLSLRITIPASLYQSGVEVEIDGIELTVKLVNEHEGHGKKREVSTLPPTAAGSPQHRKVHRRLRSPAPGYPDILSGRDDDGQAPTAEELAKSFLLEEPIHDRRALEASVAASRRSLEQSAISDGSDADDVGTGAPVSVPGFLAGFLQGVTDRAQMRIKNVDVKVETEVSGEPQELVPVTLRLRVGSVNVKCVDAAVASDQHFGQRNMEIHDVSLDLLSDAATFSQLSEVQSCSSPDSKRGSDKSPTVASAAADPLQSSRDSNLETSTQASLSDANDELATSMRNTEGHEQTEESLSPADFDIKPGDDNISWGSRRSKESAPVEDLWSSMASEDDLPDSLLLDRAPTPRAPASRSESPAAMRSRRAVSPYDRTLQSPGSWPRLDESPEGQRPQQSPGSWPMPDRSPQSVYQPLTPGPAMEMEDPMDNKRTALIASDADGNNSVAVPRATARPRERDDSPLDEMAESRFYSHEEAESLYMSAMTQGSHPKVPGGWQSKGPLGDHSRSAQNPEDVQIDNSFEGRPVAFKPTGFGQDDVGSGNATPRAQSPPARGHKIKDEHLLSKQLLTVDEVFVWLPALSESGGPPSPTRFTSHQADIPTSAARHDMPGTFSLYSESATSRYRERPPPMLDSRRSAAPSQPVTATGGDGADLELQLGRVVLAVDLACCRLLYRAISAAMVPSSEKADTSSEAYGKRENVNNESPLQPSRTLPVSLSVTSLRVSLMEQLVTGDAPARDVGLVALDCTDTLLTRSPGNVELRICRLQAWISGSELLAFDRRSTLGDSALLTEATSDITIRFSDNKVTVQNRPVKELFFELLPVKLELDLGAVDDTLGSFGGLSGVLELSNSFSEGGPLRSPSTGRRTSKGVRFAGEQPEAVKTGAELKVNGRVAGADITLHGDTCAVNLRSSTIKAVVRDNGASITIGHVLFTGPYSPSQAEAPISADLATLRLDYQYSPKDPDLERLLSLLTPSRDKYDDDKDILLDTLLRQRKKGALARVSLDDVKIKVGDFECLTELATLGAELSKLSAVTKYLPEDERPGLLSLVRVKNAEAQLPINESFGVLKLAVQEVHCAHVGLPALIALSVDSVKAMRPGHGDLIRPLIPLPAGDILPMLMARMLGDEAEPTVKVKIFNTCFEYSVPTIVALTGSSATDAEGLVADLAQSIADIAVKRVSSEKSSPTSETSRSSSKRTHIDLLVHDSALGLTPDKNSSKGLLVLTDTKFMTLVPADSTMKASLELRKAAIFLMDNQDNKAPELATAIRNAPSNTTTGARLSSVLTKQGYASVGSLMSAKIVTTIDDTGASKSVTVDVSNELLLLETCADSTQTLFAILGGLAPPAPPSKRPKYLTEPMTIEDMMASFTGEPVTETSAPPDTLFDVEEEPGDDPGMLLDPSTLGSRADDLLLESEMTSSLYGPVSGMLGGIDKPDDEVDDNEFLETVESLLEDDPFEMPISPTELGFGDSALTRELAKQCRPASKEQPVDLSIYEIEDLGLDALRGGELGSRHRFNTPTSKRRKLPLSTEKTKLPFRLRLRDTHLIWNLYDGYDWQRTRDGITRGVEQVEARAEERKARRRRSHQVEEDEESVIGDFLFNSIYVGVAATHDAQELRRQINRGIDDLASETESVSMSGMSRPTAYSASGQPLRQQQRRRLKLERSKAHKVAFELKGVSADMLVYPPEVKDVVSDLDLRVRDIDVFDNVPTSTWRKFMTCLNDGTKVREMCKPMAHIEVNTVRTLQDLAASELIIHASVLPLRLHVDQDALDFIVRFFEFKDDRISAPVDPTEQPFIQRLEVDTVDICLDYKPKRIDYGGLRSGHTNELMNMITLDAANIRLRHAIVYGIKGFEPLHKTLNDIWMPDVKRNQLPTVLAGLAPVRGLVNLGSGVRDVIAIPIREYRKDGRIVRSIQKGALHFGKTTTSELARLGAKLAIGTQTILQGAEGLLSPSSASPSGGSRPGTERGVSPSDQTWHDVGAGGGDEVEHEHRAISAYANQPIGVLSGLRSARLHLEHDLLTARDALIAVQGEILESGSPGAAAAAVARYAPTVILRPVIGASRAVGTTLLGVGNQIDRQNMRRMDDKYKRK